MKLYGIKNCDTVKKALKALEAEAIDYEFIDLKTAELSENLLINWLKKCPDTLVNKRSTTYRKIKEQWQLAEDDLSTQIQLIQSNPTVLKRPILEKDNGDVSVGFPV